MLHEILFVLPFCKVILKDNKNKIFLEIIVLSLWLLMLLPQ